MDDSEQPNSIADAQERARLDNPVLQPDETFGNYRVVRCLCAGLLAHYYHMQHLRDLHDVTVGVFHPRANGKAKFIKRLSVLKKVVGGLKHEAIPKITDCSVIDERVCLFLDAVKGHTLTQYFEAHGHPGHKGVGVAAATRIIAQLLGALGYAHAQGIDHRDLDSDLIYVQEDGSICILGMGVKAAMGVDVFESIVSASISPLETRKTLKHLNSFDVMSPEYRAGITEDSRVDIYAIGVIGYWLLTARKPEAAKYKVPTEFVEGLMPNWNIFFEKSLARDKENRFQSCKMALIGLKKTELEPTSDSSGHIQRQIDRIPVPKRILERGELASRTYRLILIGLIGVLLTGVAASFLNRVYTVKSDFGGNIVEVAESVGDANLQMRLNPAAARVTFDGESPGYFAQDGALDLKVAPGEYAIRVSAPGYVERVVSATIPEKSGLPERLNVKLSPALADIEFKTAPGAAVFLIDAEGGERLLGESDDSGVLALSQVVQPGEYDFRIVKSGYITEVLVDRALGVGSVTQISAPLTEAKVEALFLSDPQDALVRLDGDEVGRTPLRLNTLMPGKAYTIEVEKKGYRLARRQIEVESGEELTVDLGPLIPESGSVRLQLIRMNGTAVTEPLLDELEIVLDGQRKPYSGDALSSLPVGPTTLQLQHPLYRSEIVRLEIEDGENYVVPLTLVPRPGEVSLKIPQEIDYSLLIDNQPVVQDELPVEVAARRVVQLELRMTNYLTMRRQILLKPTENFVWEVDPGKSPILTSTSVGFPPDSLRWVALFSSMRGFPTKGLRPRCALSRVFGSVFTK
jgi:serine/threonine protein kinase